MGVPGHRAPADLASTELFAVDAHRDVSDATVAEVERDAGRVGLARTAFQPGLGGQPCDLGTILTPASGLTVTGKRIRLEVVDADAQPPSEG